MAEARSQAWTALVSRMSLPQRSLGKDILDPAVVPDWSTIESYGNKWEIPSSNPTAGRQALAMSTGEDRAYFLGVIQGRVVSLWGLREMAELHEDGGRYAAFAGDFREVAGVSTPPPLMTLPEIASRQAFKNNVFVTRQTLGQRGPGRATDTLRVPVDSPEPHSASGLSLPNFPYPC